MGLRMMKVEYVAANDELIAQLCTCYLARNFMWVISCSSFTDLPYELLLSCIKHAQLTIDSEKNLCCATLAWLYANIFGSECFSTAECDWSDILKQIRTRLLPLGFISGKRRCPFFSKFADNGINGILSLVRSPSTSSMTILGDSDSCDLKIRLTEYTKKLDLSGCPQIKPEFLLLSLLPSSYNLKSKLRRTFKQPSEDLEYFADYKLQISPEITVPIFNAVHEVDISNCSRLNLEAAIQCFCKSFPSLRTLKAVNFLNFKTENLHQLVQRCPLLCEIDLSVDLSPVIPAKVSVLSSWTVLATNRSTLSSSIDKFLFAVPLHCPPRPLLSNITMLTLRGRIDISDPDLHHISELCASLHYIDLTGCTSVADASISCLILKCMNLQSILACDTSFGENSIQALCSGDPSFAGISPTHAENPSLSRAYKLQVLHIGGCNSISEASLLKLISRTFMLRSLCLRDTLLGNDILYNFSGSSLEILNVSNTKVSGPSLAHIARRNPGLKSLKARGCRHLLQEYPTCSNTCRELLSELGKSFNLEEIALGWGFSFRSLDALAPAIGTLRSVVIGLGGSLGEGGLKLLPTLCPLLETVIIYFQVISDSAMINITTNLLHLQVFAICRCFGEMSSLCFQYSLPSLRKLKLERVAAWINNNDLVILTENCRGLVELSLQGCPFLNSESQDIMSSGWPGLISIHLEDCGQLTRNGITSFFDCHGLEDLVLRHNGSGIQKDFVALASSKLPMLRKISLDTCDAKDEDFDIPDYVDRYFLSFVKIARCKRRRRGLDSTNSDANTTPVHKETLVLVWDSKKLTRTVVKERV